MFEVIVEKIIQSCLADYISGFESQQLKVSLWNGKISLENVRLNPEILIKLQLPMVFKYSKISKIDIFIPWTSLATKSVEISISGIYCIAVPFAKENWSSNLDYFVDKIQENLKNYEIWWMFEKEKKKADEKAEGKKGYLDDLKDKVIRNLKVNLSGFHLRYEDQFSKTNYSLGLQIESIQMLPSPESIPESKISLNIQGLNFYINVQGAHMQNPEDQIKSYLDNNTVLQLSTSIEMIQLDNERQIFGKIEEIQFELTHLQLIYCIKLNHKFSKYLNFLTQQTDQRKYLIYSPIERTPKNLWKFAVSTVIRILRQKRHVSDIFVMSFKTKIFYKNHFVRLLHKKKASKSAKLEEGEELLYRKILYLCEWDDLVIWQTSVLEELSRKKDEKKGWFGFLSKGGKEVFTPEVYVQDYVPAVAKAVNTVLNLICVKIELRLATYDAQKLMIQSQTVNLLNCTINATITEHYSDLCFCIKDLLMHYTESNTSETLMKMVSDNDQPGMLASFKLYSDNKTPNEIKYISKLFEINANPKAISHLFNFVSLKALSDNKKKKIVDNLKNIQEMALSQISDIFYYEKTYKIEFFSPCTRVLIPSETGQFILNLNSLKINDRARSENEFYASLDASLQIEVLFNDLQIVPNFEIQLDIRTLNKIILVQKWANSKTPYDSMFDIEIFGKVEKFMFNFYVLLINEFKYLEKNLKLYETKELVVLNKASILKDSEAVSLVELTYGFYSQKCLIVLNGDSIYFFQDEKADKAFDFFCVTGCSIQRDLNEIVLVKQSKNIKLKFSKDNFCSRWFSLLFTKVKATIEPIQGKKMEKELFRYNFVVQKTQAKIISTEFLELYSLCMDHHELVACLNDFSMKFSIKTHSASVKNQFGEDVFYFGNKDFPETIDLSFFKKDSKFFTGQDIEIFVNFQSFHLFFSKSALEQMLYFQSTLMPKENPSENVEQNIMKVGFGYNISQIFIDFYKGPKETGKFELGTINGNLILEGSALELDGGLSSMKIQWKDKETQEFVHLLDLQEEKQSKYNIKYQKDLKITTKIDSAQIFYLPGIVKSLQKYFKALIPEVKQESSPVQPGSLEINTQVNIENFKFSAKKLNSHKESFTFHIVFAELASNSLGFSLTLGEIQGTSQNLMLVHQQSKLTYKDNALDLKSSDINLYITASDLHYLLNFFDPIELEPQQKPQIKAEKTELACSILLENISLQLIDKQENLSINSNSIQISVNQSQCLTIGLASPSLSCLFNGKSVACLMNSNENFAFIEISDKGYVVNVCPAEVLFDFRLIWFIKGFVNTAFAVVDNKQAKKTIEKFEYEVNLPELQIKMEFVQAHCKIFTDLKIKYLVHVQECDIDFGNLSIVKFLENDQFELVERCRMNLFISFFNGSYLLKFPGDVVGNFNLEDINQFYGFLLQDSAKMPEDNSKKVETVTVYMVEYTAFTVNLLTKFRESFIKANLCHETCKIQFSSKTEFDMRSQLSVSYYSSLIQSYETLLEPFDFTIVYTYEPSPSPLSNLSLVIPKESDLSLCLTDTVIKDLYHRFYEKSSKIQSLSIYNNTGCKINLIFADNYSIEIQDKDIKPVKPIKSDEYLSVSLEMENSQKLILSRLPLHIEGIYEHQLSKTIEIISKIEIIGQTKQIKVSSPVEIRNQTQIQFSVAFFIGDQNEPVTVKLLDQLCMISVPLNCCKGKVMFIPQNTPADQCRKVSISQIKESSPYCKSGDFSFLLQYEKPVISIWPSLTVKNVLPTYISICFNDMKEFLIQPNEYQDFFIPPLKSSLYLTVNHFNKTGPIPIFDKKISKKIEIKNESFATEVGLVNNNENSLRVTFYPYYLITNLTMIPISFYIQYKNSFVNISKDFRDNKFFIGKVENLLIELDRCFSSPLPIDSLNRKNFEISNHGSIFQFVHSTTVAKIPGESKFTKVFSVWSKLILTNCMDEDIKVVQTETDTRNFTYIKSGKSTYFNWASYGINFLMSIWIEKVSNDWTGGFYIKKSGTFYIKIENQIQKIFVKVNIKEEDEITNIIFYKAYESDIKIVNKCEFLIKVHQAGCQVCEVVNPDTEEYFAWHSQGLKSELVVKCYYSGVWQNILVNVEKIGELNVCELPDFKNIFVYAEVTKDANSLAVIVSEKLIQEYVNPYPCLVASIFFHKIFLSFIQHDVYRKKEIMLVTLFGFNFNLSQYTKCIEWKVELTDLQMDSQIFEFIVCPIFFISDGNDPLALSGRLVFTEKWTCLENIHLDMKNFIVNVDNNLLESILDYYKRFYDDNSSYNLDYYLTNSLEKNELLTSAWIFLDGLKVSSFVIKLSYKNTTKNAKDHFKSFLINFDDIMVFLEETVYTKLYGSPSTIAEVISSTYRKMIMSNLDLILKQHGMIGGAFMLAVKISNGIAKIGKRSKQPESKEAKLVYEEKLRQHRQNNTIRFTRCLKQEEMQNKLGELKEKSGIESFSDIVNNPVNSFLNLFKKKDKKTDDSNIITKYKQRPSRVFYGRFSVIQPFSMDDCHVVSILRMKNQEFCQYFFYGQSIGTNYKNQKKIVAVVFDKAAVLMDDQSKILWEILPICIDSMERVNENFVISGLDKTGKKVRLSAGFMESESIRKFEWLIKQVRRELDN